VTAAANGRAQKHGGRPVCDGAVCVHFGASMDLRGRRGDRRGPFGRVMKMRLATQSVAVRTAVKLNRSLVCTSSQRVAQALGPRSTDNVGASSSCIALALPGALTRGGRKVGSPSTVVHRGDR